MARYEHLPIYKQAMDVAVHFEKVVALFLVDLEVQVAATEDFVEHVGLPQPRPSGNS